MNLDWLNRRTNELLDQIKYHSRTNGAISLAMNFAATPCHGQLAS